MKHVFPLFTFLFSLFLGFCTWMLYGLENMMESEIVISPITFALGAGALATLTYSLFRFKRNDSVTLTDSERRSSRRNLVIAAIVIVAAYAVIAPQF